MRYQRYLESAGKVIRDYRPGQPLPHYLRNYYRANRQMGSTDRRTVSSLVYAYFRARFMLEAYPLEEQLILAWFLCHDQPTPLLEAVRPSWLEQAGQPAGEKLRFLEEEMIPLDLSQLFPFAEALSPEIPSAEYALSLLRQPDLFLRLRPFKEEEVKARLRDAGLAFRELSPSCIAVDNGSPLQQVLAGMESDFVVQDASSQLTAIFFRPNPGEDWWDACAGSGGKSLVLKAIEPSVKLYVSDNRKSILHNLKERFRLAGIRQYRLAETDVTHRLPFGDFPFDGIILDAPCSGSGTWGRSPEMMSAFSEPDIKRFARLQMELVKKAQTCLKPGCPLIYITCSVFREENELLVEEIQRSTPLRLEEQEYLDGYELKADTLFVARLYKPTAGH